MEVHSCIQGKPACGLPLAPGRVSNAMIVLTLVVVRVLRLEVKPVFARLDGRCARPRTSIAYTLPLAISTARKTARDLFSDSSNPPCRPPSPPLPPPPSSNSFLPSTLTIHY